MNKISIVIPIYNVENYLPQCLDSVINQTYKNLEIILVNDGSTDTCPQICDEYAAKDSRITVIHQENGGSAKTRNKGLQKATGDFISFVDSDDFISENFYQKLFNILIENNAEIVECSYRTFDTELELQRIIKPTYRITGNYETEKALELLMKEYLKQVVWNKIYRREILADIKFPVGKFIDDEYWTYKVFGNAKKIVKIPDVMYFYRQQEGSIMGKEYSIKRLDGLTALQERIDYMKENFPNLENLAIKIFSFASLWHYQKIDKHSEIDQEMIYRKKIVACVKAYNKRPILKSWKIKEVFWYQFFITAPNLCAKLRNFINVGI